VGKAGERQEENRMSYDASIIGRPVSELDTPSLLVDLDAMERNIARTVSMLNDAGVHWRPHCKGHKVPAIAHMQVVAGAIGVTCAKLGEAEVMVSSGIRSILIANQIVGPQKVTRLANLCRRAEVITSVDSAENVEELNEAGQRKGVRIPAVVEVETGMGRCGVLPGDPVLALSRLIHDSAGLQYMGLMSWEGHARRFIDPDERRAVCEEAVGLLVSSAQMCRKAGLPVQIVSCGGTGTHAFSSRVAGVSEIQAGGIVFNDMYYSQFGLDHDFALTVSSTVTSRPTSLRIVTDAGRKTMSRDTALPVPVGLYGVKSVGLSAEHGQIDLDEPNLSVKVGDRLHWIVGYADTSVHLHEHMYGVRDGIVEVVWPILGRGKLR
jgi:D-serine deaminase-like pyridoxal phosphate-dependent protein